ncbi:F-box family protein, partial [Trifolium medium]|nr:F-box family protein [Trifolium medium]
FDVLRFRSVCTLWRSILPPPFPSPSDTLRIRDGKFLLLTEAKIYRLQPLLPTCSSNKGWIIKVEKSKSGKFRHLDVLTNTQISHTFPSNVLDFMNLRVRELFQAYTLNFSSDGGDFNTFEPLDDVYKVVLFSDEGLGQMVFTLRKDGKLRVSNIGCTNLIIVDDGNRVYHDIILYMGKVHVVDKSGIIFWINCSSFKLVQSSPSLNNDGRRKNLVESNGSLFVVEMYFRRTGVNTSKLVIDISVLKVVDNESSRWLRVTDLGDVLFVLGQDLNFSLSANDYYGFERNCIYCISKGRTARFSLNNSGFKFVDDIFWPCPTLFNSDLFL